MPSFVDNSRRRLLKKFAMSVALAPFAVSQLHSATAGDAPLVTPDDQTAKAFKYVADAAKSAEAKPGSRCGNCMLYQGAAGSVQGGCPLFTGKQVKAAGWCNSWTAKS